VVPLLGSNRNLLWCLGVGQYPCQDCAVFQDDKVSVGTPEERAARKMGDVDDGDVKAGHMYPGVPIFAANFQKAMTLEEITDIESRLIEQQQSIKIRLETLEKLKKVETQHQKVLQDMDLDLDEGTDPDAQMMHDDDV
jgi:hypothetical protein